MSWKDRMIPASFRGAFFYIEDSDRECGINAVFQELIPDDDTTEAVQYVDDLGKGLDQFSIEGYVIQNKDNGYDYFVQRDALIQALNTRGPGILKHPYYGEIKVYLVGKARVKESTKEGGIARFSMTFSQFNELPDPARTISSDQGVDSSTDDDISKASDVMADKLNLTGVHIDSLANTIKVGLQKFVETIRKVRGTVSQYQSEAIAYLADIITSIDAIVDEPIQLLNTIQNAGQQLLNVCGLGVETIIGGTIGEYSDLVRGDKIILDGKSVPENIAKSVIDGAIEAASYSYEDISYVQEEQIKNTKLILAYLKIILMGTIAKIAIRTIFNSQEIAEDYRDKIKEAMDDVLLIIGDLVDEEIDDSLLYESMDDLRNSFMSSFEIKIAGIKKSVTFTTPPDGMSCLEIAYRKYYDLDRAEDIFERNRSTIKHPSFCTGGEELKILNE